MNGTTATLRDHMLAATMHNRWETLTEITGALRSEYGLRALPADVLTWLRELAKDGTHSLASRPRSRAGDYPVKEYRLYVKPDAITFGGPHRASAQG